MEDTTLGGENPEGPEVVYVDEENENEVDLPTYLKRAIRQWESKAGGYRQDENHESYFLTAEELVQFETKSFQTEDDAAFWTWFRDFREQKHIRAHSNTYVKRGALSTIKDTWDKTWSGTKTTGKYLSSWWADDLHGTNWGGSWGKSADGKAQKLALVIQAVQRVVRVVDDTVPPMTVEWANTNMSATSFDEHRIWINPKPVLETTKADIGEAIDITTGFGLHEASHSKSTGTRKIANILKQPTELTPVGVSGLLMNIIEDVRIEADTGKEFPGFRGYFEKSLAWLWRDSKSNLPKTWGSLGDKLNAIITICKWPDEVKTALVDPSFAPEIPWWTDWLHDYLDERVSARETVERGMARLASDPETKKEMERQAAEEETLRKLAKDFEQFVKSAIDEMRKKGKLMNFCESEEKSKIDAETAESVDSLVKSELREEHTPHPDTGNSNCRIVITHPPEGDDSRRSYIGKPSPNIARLRGAIQLRRAAPEWTNRLLKSGQLDEEELWRPIAGDYRVFEQRVIEKHPKTLFGLLVDMSGSMYGHKIETAQKLAQLFIWALKDMEGIEPMVWGHTANVTSHDDCDVYELWQRGEPLTRLGLIQTLPHDNNWDGHAIAWVGKQLRENPGDYDQRVLVVLSDGYPAAEGYGGAPAYRHVRSVTDKLDKDGVTVIQIAIDSGMDSARQSAMFKNWIAYTDEASLPGKLAQLMSKVTV